MKAKLPGGIRVGSKIEDVRALGEENHAEESLFELEVSEYQNDDGSSSIEFYMPEKNQVYRVSFEDGVAVELDLMHIYAW